jgi:hypothetical protein
MSGGHFNYQQYAINGLVDSIERLLNKKEFWDSKTEDYYVEFVNSLSEETIDEFKRAIRILKLAEVYSNRIDWLVSGDDSEESFHKRIRGQIGDLGISMNVVANI